MDDTLAALRSRVGEYAGEGLNHEGQRYRGRLTLRERFAGLAITARATGLDDGSVHHEEESLLAPRPAGGLGLWVLSSNHPGVVEHVLDPAWPPAAGAERTVAFRAGDPDDRAAFREVVAFDLWPDGSVTHRYAWGLPGGDFADRSGARLTPCKQTPVSEAATTTSERGGVAPQGPGWFVVNLAQARWFANERFGRVCCFEGDARFEQLGVNVHVLDPGQPACHYHGEADQEDFLVLHGRCRLVVEGQERLLEPWDFVHCPPWTRHVFVGAGDGPCAILMIGGRAREGLIYPLDPLAQRYDACAPRETESARESYAERPPWAEVAPDWPLETT